jgi:hypothetical protein
MTVIIVIIKIIKVKRHLRIECQRCERAKTWSNNVKHTHKTDASDVHVSPNSKISRRVTITTVGIFKS